jgi:hypothetical protein
MFHRDGQLVAKGWWMTEAHSMDLRVVVPRELAEVNITTASEPIQLWNERLVQQYKRHVRNVLESMIIIISISF